MTEEELAAQAAAAEKAAAEKAAAEKAAAEKAEAERLEAERLEREKNGGKPTEAEAKLLKENMKKKEELKAAAEEKAKLEAALKQFEGIDVEEVKKLLAEKKTAEEKALEAKGDWERLKNRMAEEHKKELEAVSAAKKALEEELGKTKSTIGELSVGSKFSQSKFIADELTLTPSKARVIYADHFDIEDGKVVGYDKPRGAANRTALVDASGNAVDFDTALRKIVEADPEKDDLLKAKAKPGAGSSSKPKPGESTKSGEKDSIARIGAGLAALGIKAEGNVM